MGHPVESLVNEFTTSARVSGDKNLAAIEAALFLEDCFGMNLTDVDIDPDRLGSAEDLTQLVKKRLGR